MKLMAEFEGNETMTSIGFVKSLIDTKWFRDFDLCEISCYLNTYCTARNVEPICRLANIAKGGEGDGNVLGKTFKSIHNLSQR